MNAIYTIEEFKEVLKTKTLFLTEDGELKVFPYKWGLMMEAFFELNEMKGVCLNSLSLADAYNGYNYNCYKNGLKFIKALSGNGLRIEVAMGLYDDYHVAKEGLTIDMKEAGLIGSVRRGEDEQLKVYVEGIEVGQEDWVYMWIVDRYRAHLYCF